jgi:hypothetical protein
MRWLNIFLGKNSPPEPGSKTPVTGAELKPVVFALAASAEHGSELYAGLSRVVEKTSPITQESYGQLNNAMLSYLGTVAD